MTTLAANLSDSATEMRVNAADPSPAPYYQIDDEIVRLLQNSTTVQVGDVSPNRELDLTLWQIERGDAETTPAAHLSGATLEPLWPQVPGAGGPGGSLTLDNQSDPPTEITTLIAPGATIAGDEADLSNALSILSRSTNLTDAQIKALPGTSIELVPAPGAGFLLYPLGAVLRLTWVADYTNIDAAAKMAVTQGATAVDNPAFLTILEEVDVGLSGLLALGASAFAFVGPRLLSGADGNFMRGASGWSTFDVENVGLYLDASNGAAGNFQDGDPGNSLKVTVVYAVIDV